MKEPKIITNRPNLNYLMNPELDVAIAKVGALQNRVLGTFTAKELADFWMEIDYELFGIQQLLKTIKQNTEKL